MDAEEDIITNPNYEVAPEWTGGVVRYAHLRVQMVSILDDGLRRQLLASFPTRELFTASYKNIDF